ncbi:NADH-quinone oxidoreductase subunit L [Chryseolinea lacunae]|uniref:NADH-quinone oxidoreductase subunit L n=1 Tax=Chryseolinea lacunae TaxID=2801331 RepID=A0ABS1KXS3_9BACT|nr:NADH-quinone oxidoreductase subunit L [Chryseolinea lacunae]MBL0744265.1 NADH-quinone oxidoreductase subunit L [Chryseolinea lacunae]
MKELLWLIPAWPLAGALILILGGHRMSRTLATLVGAGSVGLSALITLLIGFAFLSAPEPFDQHLWTWMAIGNFQPSFAFHLDALSMIFLFVITFVGFLIHIYSSEFMAGDEGFARFFAYLNLFVCSMLILVLADNLLLLYLGWEGVGLCSYLLIGFWYQEEKNGYAARKAFIVTRVGDTAMAIGLFILFQTFGTLHIQSLLQQAPQAWSVGDQTALLVGFLLLGGAVGKSAQLPLQTWLPDAMAGPSPVSALIHAATMVTAGVYLIARTHVIFELAPQAQLAVGIVGAVTLLLAGFSALTQNDLKRVLAYSTISQIGYMFLALGVGAWSAAIFHFMIHAFFKALLFLGAGAIILVLHHEHDMFKMGGLRHKLPVIYGTFLIGAASLAAIPLVTGGFYSKDQILWLAWAGERGNVLLYLAALFGAFITSVYTFRMVFVTFFGAEHSHVSHPVGKAMLTPLVVLAVLSTLAGFLELPHTLGHVTIFSDFLSPVLPAVNVRPDAESMELLFQVIAAVVALSGVGLAYYLYVLKPDLPSKIKEEIPGLHHLWFVGWGFDALYDTLLVRPFVYIAKVNKHDVLDKFYTGLVTVAEFFHRALAYTQSGMMRWYVMGIVIGAILMLTIGLIL